MDKLEWWQQHQKLWDQLVPKTGQAKTVQGALIRCTGKLIDEACRNGNQNWDSDFEQMLAFVSKTLSDLSMFDSEQLETMHKATQTILNNIGQPTCQATVAPIIYSVKWRFIGVRYMQNQLVMQRI